MASRVSTGHAKISGAKINKKVAREIMNGDDVKAMLKKEADRIAGSMNAEGRGEFRSGIGTRKGKTRAHAFVNTYDHVSKHTANDDPGIFRRHI